MRRRAISTLCLLVGIMLPGSWQGVDADEKEVYYTEGPLRGSLRRDIPVAIYAADPQEAWNRIYHLLYARTMQVNVVEGVRAASGTATAPFRVERLEGGDIPEFFFTASAQYLLEEPRYEALVSGLRAELEHPSVTSRSLEARLLFQQDLWNRFDALYDASPDGSNGVIAQRAQQLLALLGTLIARLALAPAELATVSSNFDPVAAAFPEVVDPHLFDGETSWRELVSTFPEPMRLQTTAHAQRADCRIVFRRFVKVPEEAGGPACLTAVFQPERSWEDRKRFSCVRGGLAPGSRALLVETPLAISSAGTLVAVPLVIGMQARQVPTEESSHTEEGQARGRFHVLHGQRSSLALLIAWRAVWNA